MQFFDLVLTLEFWISLITLATLEIVLGIDNLIFITILAGRAPLADQRKIRRIGLGAALITRLILLTALSYLMKLKDPLFTLYQREFSVHSLILIFGGLFLLAKSTLEIYATVENDHHKNDPSAAPQKIVNISGLIAQIMLIDIVFSFDSVITAVGMVSHQSIMVIAILVATVIMMSFAGPVGDFIDKNPSFKILALSFLVMVGILLVGEGLGEHINRGYIYFGMAFSFTIELLNLRFHQGKKKQKKH